MGSSKQLRWYNIAVIAFVSVWGLGNVVNNYATQGISVIFSWILIMILYFIPYALIVGQLGSTFKDSSGGVSSWVKNTTTKKIGYFAAWTYWVVHIPYLAQKPQQIVIAFNWIFKQNGTFIQEAGSTVTSFLSLIIFLFFLWVASKGLTTLKRIGSIAGTAMFIMSLLFILLAISAPLINQQATLATPNMGSLKTYLPTFNLNYFTTISMLVFAVGGAEKISPYVNDTKNPAKEFPKGMLALAAMIAVCAILGSFSMGMLFDSNNIPKDLMANGAYVAFGKLGVYYGVGNLFVVIYAIAQALAQISALAFSIDAPLKILLADSDKEFIPASFAKMNENDVPLKGYALTGILVSILIIVPGLGMKSMNELYNWLLNLNAVVMPLRYLWVFFAFMMVNKLHKDFTSEYKFIRRPKLGYLVGLWCFLFTAFACLLGIIPKDIYADNPTSWLFKLSLNIITPIVLLALGFIFPILARRQNKLKD
ncbi:amino acid permease [Vagococcus penaei]|uniref:Transporter n=1 Tax=Vagococcus penaei TaxID=633807 RepID=A0A1Q2D3G0_9ENTE|nr:amino acid permease [Vagococcus penaei]AQP52851.1 transporter [Vagococcus penaei]RST98180.1 amino acid permease [Vagococcus penaei]